MVQSQTHRANTVISTNAQNLAGILAAWTREVAKQTGCEARPHRTNHIGLKVFYMPYTWLGPSLRVLAERWMDCVSSATLLLAKPALSTGAHVRSKSGNF